VKLTYNRHTPDIVILGNTSGANHIMSESEKKDLENYINTHKRPRLLGTFCMFRNPSHSDNSFMAPYFGIMEGLKWELYTAERDSSELVTFKPCDAKTPFWDHFKNKSIPIVISWDYSQAPENKAIGGGEYYEDLLLPGANLESISAHKKAAIITYQKDNLKSIYMSVLPEYNTSSNNLNYIYEAILYLMERL